MDKELIIRARQASGVEELLSLAKENGIELTEEQAREYFSRLHSAEGEISDAELDAVSGGGCGGDASGSLDVHCYV